MLYGIEEIRGHARKPPLDQDAERKRRRREQGSCRTRVPAEMTHQFLHVQRASDNPSEFSVKL
jgi:hypothetical protein